MCPRQESELPQLEPEATNQEAEMAEANRRAAVLEQMAQEPGRTDEQKATYLNLARSCKAEAGLRSKAIAYKQSQQAQTNPSPDPTTD
jgi:hypothetical protein